MKIVECRRCGSKELREEDGYATCVYCRSKYVIEPVQEQRPESTIGVASDIELLLDKCRSDPANGRRYASLVLDLDPTNTEARRYLKF